MSQSPIDRFARSFDAVSDPARKAFPVVPSDTAPLSHLSKALFIGASGTIVVRAVDSDTDVSLAVAVGQILPLRVAFVRATGTTAGQIVALA